MSEKCAGCFCHTHGDNSTTRDVFWRSQSLAEMASAQGVRPIASPAALHATFWPEDDEEDFLASVRRWRQEA